MRQSTASAEEAAAIAAAIEQFLRDTAPVAPLQAGTGGWTRAAVVGGAGIDYESPGLWGDPEPWGRPHRSAE